MMTLLKEANESDAKNFFGQYVSKRMKDWSDILKLYEKDNIHLADASHILQSQINYDLPAYKKSSEQSRKQAEEMERKQVEWEKNLVQYQHKYQQSIQELNIEGLDIRNEIILLQNEIPSMLNNIVIQSKHTLIQEAIQFYEEFNKFTCGPKDKEIDNSTILPTLKNIIRSKEEDTKVDVTSNAVPESPEEIEIDWTVIDSKDTNNAAPAEDIINWDITVENTEESASSSIVWDIEDNVIELVDSQMASLPQNTISNQTTSNQSNTLENTQTRIQFLDDILEVTCYHKLD
jgi:hypothetical protein